MIREKYRICWSGRTDQTAQSKKLSVSRLIANPQTHHCLIGEVGWRSSVLTRRARSFELSCVRGREIAQKPECSYVRIANLCAGRSMDGLLADSLQAVFKDQTGGADLVLD